MTARADHKHTLNDLAGVPQEGIRSSRSAHLLQLQQEVEQADEDQELQAERDRACARPERGAAARQHQRPRAAQAAHLTGKEFCEGLLCCILT